MMKVVLLLLLVTSTALTYVIAAAPKLRHKLEARINEVPSHLIAGASLLAHDRGLTFSKIDTKIPGGNCASAGGITFRRGERDTLIPKGEFIYGMPLQGSTSAAETFSCRFGDSLISAFSAQRTYALEVSRNINKPVSFALNSGSFRLHSRTLESTFYLNLYWGLLKVKLPPNSGLNIERFNQSSLFLFLLSPNIELEAIPNGYDSAPEGLELRILPNKNPYTIIFPNIGPQQKSHQIRYNPINGMQDIFPPKTIETPSLKKSSKP